MNRYVSAALVAAIALAPHALQPQAAADPAPWRKHVAVPTVKAGDTSAEAPEMKHPGVYILIMPLDHEPPTSRND